MPLPTGRYYGAFAGNVAFLPGDFMLDSTADSITATAGGGINGAFQLNTQIVRIGTVASIGDSVMLPPSQGGIDMLLINHGANAMQVFGQGGDTIDDQPNANGVSQMSNSTVLYICATAGRWYTEGLSSGFAPSLGLQTFSYVTIAANSTVTQAAGTPVTAMLNNVTAAAAGAVTLPASSPGLEITVHNISAANAITVFPNAGGTGAEKINAGGSNVGQAMGVNQSTVYTCAVAGQWYSVPRIPS